MSADDERTCIYCGVKFKPPGGLYRDTTKKRKYPMCGDCKERYNEDRYGFAQKGSQWANSTFRKII